MTHIIDGEFQSDRHPWAPRDFLTLDLKDPISHRAAWLYAECWRGEDPHFADELQAHLRAKGFEPETLL